MKILNKKLFVFILILLALILVYLIYEFVILEFYFNALEENYKEISSNYNEMFQNIKLNKYYNDRLNELLNEVKNLNFLIDLKQEKIIETLRTNMKKYNVQAVDITFSEVMPLNCESKAEDEIINDSENKLNKKAEISTLAVTMSVKLKFNSSLENMLLFIDALQNNTICITITNIYVIPYESDMVYTEMDLKFYALPLEGNN